MIEAGQKLPDFTLANQDGELKSDADYAGKWLVLYIYPKDDTPGCTIQGKSFTATRDAFDKAGIRVVGLSADDVASHKAFCNKFSLTIDLLADPEAKLLGALGAGQKEYAGVMYWNRTTFVVDPHGMVRRVYTGVKPEGHEQVLLDDIAELRKAAV
jgi:peroxiredoxin Q/BCP